ncbi:MAG: hypothetical protein II965_06515, partial [Pyramidobacter sp.]|nr:hypothetical protein [Pyramidobacter sp.]
IRQVDGRRAVPLPHPGRRARADAEKVAFAVAKKYPRCRAAAGIFFYTCAFRCGARLLKAFVVNLSRKNRKKRSAKKIFPS